MTIIFDSNYYAESIADLPRDVSEAFQKDYNKKLKEDIQEHQTVHVVLSFENEKKTICVNRNYSAEELSEVEDELWECVSNLKDFADDVDIDQHGFYPGTIHLQMTLKEY